MEKYATKNLSNIYLEAANRVMDELEARGFSTEDPGSSYDLLETIAFIIKSTVDGNYNFVVPDVDSQILLSENINEAAVSFNPWNGGIQSQIT